MARQPERGASRTLVTILAAALILGLLGWGLYKLVSGSNKVQRKAVPEVVQLRILQPPPLPPPPPPPPKDEPPPLKQPEFQRVTPEAQPPSPSPKAPTPPGPPALDAPGSGPGDGFGLEGRPGGGDYLGGGDGSGGGGGSKYGWYATLVQQQVQSAVNRQRKLLSAQYRVTVQMWLDEKGKPRRVELRSSTGKPELDRLLEDIILDMPRVSEAPPTDLPQPVVFSVSAT